MAFLGLVCLLAVHAEGADDNPNQAVMGVWVAQTMEADGKAPPPEVIAKMRFTFTADKLLVRGNFSDDREQECTYKLDAKANPKQFDFTPPNEPKPILGIYDVTGDTLKVCIRHASSTEGRPTEFVSKEGSKLLLLVFKKQK